MQILSIDLNNIKCHRDTHIDFVAGVNVLSGPNGVGKSTVFEAVGYALFGVDAKEFVGRIDRFITSGEKKGRISVTFETDKGECYQVTRWAGGGSKWLLATETEEAGHFEVEEHAGAAETEERIKELLGLQGSRSLADQFRLIIGPLQHEFLGPFVTKGKKRREMFDEILNINSWQKTWEGTRVLASALKSRIELLNAEVSAKQEQLVDLPEKKSRKKELKRNRKRIEKELNDKEKRRNLADTQLVDLDNKETELMSCLSEVKILETRLAEGKGKIATQEQRLEEAKHAQRITGETKKAKQAFESADKLLGELNKQQTEHRRMEKEAADLEQKRIRAEQNLHHEQEEMAQTIKRLTTEQRALEQQFKGLKPENELLQRAAGQEKLQMELEELRSGRDLLDGRSSELSEGKEQLSKGVCPFFQEKCLNLENGNVDDTYDKGLARLKKEKDVLTTQIKTAEGRLKDAIEARDEKNRLETRAKEVQKQLESLNDQLIVNDKRKAKIQQLQKELEHVLKQVDLKKKELSPFHRLDQLIERTEKEKKRYQAGRDRYLAHQKVAEEYHNRHTELEIMKKLFVELQGKHRRKSKEKEKLQKVYTGEQHRKVRKQKEELGAEIASRSQQLQGLGREYDQVNIDIQRLEVIAKEVDKAASEQKKMVEKQSLVEFLRKQVFNHVSERLSERIREEISLRADRIYRTIGETEEELYWGDNYRIVLRDMDGGEIRERDDDQLSGGQLMSAVVALRLAMLQSIDARIAFFDEPTSNLDSTRRENLARAFRAIDVGREELSAHWYDQLFLISHDVAFTEVTDQIISLE